MSKALLKQLCGKHAIIILVIIMVIVPSLPASFSSQSGSAIEQVKGSAIPGNANGSSITNSSFHTDILGSRITGYVATGNSTVPINKKVGSLSVVITLKYQDQAGLNSYLQELQDPSSPFYHHYLTHREFVQRYSPPAEVYNSLNKYLASRGFDTKTYSDRVSVGVSGSASQFDSLFHTSIMNVKKGNSTFYAPVKPVSLGWQYHGAISNVAGLSDEHTAQISPLFTGPSGSEVLFGSDLQAAYQLDKLYQARGYPTNETVATILWSGAYNGSSVAPFVPSDISYYFSHNLPPGEPEPVFYGLPVGGAPLPGPSAKNDSTRANYESTLDLEMAGSTAPGATLVEVYGPSPTMSYLDQAFAEILNPNYNTTLDNALSHVTAISNSWGGGDSYDSSWVQYEQESAARGITVLASSGDNGNTGNPAPGFPATVGYDSYGTLAVGGTQTSVAGNASNDGTGTTGIASQSVWYNSPSSGDGSQGGVSSVYSEPSWQLNSPDANGVITGNSTITGVQSGRGTPDVAAVGANMWMYMSTYSYGTGYYELWGTSVASPLDAGLIATMDHYTGSMEGFMNPLIYSLGQDQFQGLYNGPPPFYWIYNGSNGEFSSARGYNLVDGWGSINAYNLILAEQSFESVTLTESGLPSGTRWYVNLTNGQSFSSTSNSISFSEPSGTYGYTASSENGRLVPSSPAGQFSVNGSPVSLGVTFQGRSYSVVFSETGLPPPYEWYVNLSNGLSSGLISSSSYTASLPNGTYSYTVSSGNKSYSPGISSGSFTVQGAAMTVPPVSFSEVRYTFTFNEINLKPGMTWYLNVSGQHSSGPVSSTSYSLKLPNGTYSYTAASTDKRYVPSPSYGTATVNGGPGSLAISFSELDYYLNFTESGLPAGTVWYANLSDGGTAKVSGSSASFSEPNGTYYYNISRVQGYEASTYSGRAEISGSATTVPIIWAVARYNITFTEQNLPAGTEWYINVSGANHVSSTSGNISLDLPNGTYGYTFSSGSPYSSGGNATLAVRGSGMVIPVHFTPLFAVSVNAGALPAGSLWYINFTSPGGFFRNVSGTSGTLTAILPNGTYEYSAWYPASDSEKTGSVTVDGRNSTISADFHRTSVISFRESGLPQGTKWSVRFNGTLKSSNGSYLNFTVRDGNGTFSFEVPDVTGYTVSRPSGSISINGTASSASVALEFTAMKEPARAPANAYYIAIGAMAAITVASTAGFYALKRRR